MGVRTEGVGSGGCAGEVVRVWDRFASHGSELERVLMSDGPVSREGSDEPSTSFTRGTVGVFSAADRRAYSIRLEGFC